MSGERQGGNQNNPGAIKLSKPGMEIKNEVDEVEGSVSRIRKFIESKRTKRVVSKIFAGLAVTNGVPGLVAAEMENTSSSDKEIVIEGEMPSQKALGGEMAGGGGESPQYITLKPGDKGPGVEKLKQGFYDYGYFKNESSVNDTYTTSTAEYVKKFEKINGLPVDGIADSEMQALFFSDSALKADGTPVVVTEVALKSEEIQTGLETGVPVMPVEVVNKPETLLIDVKEEKEVNQKFSDFLNGVGEYSDEELKLKLWGNVDKVQDLGFSKMSADNHFIFQGILLFHKNIDGEEILALGLKDRTEKRIITAVTWPIDSLLTLGYGVHTGESIGKSYTNSIPKSYFDESEIGSLLDKNSGLLVNFTMNMIPDAHKNGYPTEEYGNIYISLFANKGNINRDFLTGIWRPKRTDMLSSMTREVFEKYRDKSSVQEINDYSDFLDLTNNSDVLPFVTVLYY